MAMPGVSLDKAFQSELSEDYGSIVIRVVVLGKVEPDGGRDDELPPADAEPEEMLDDVGVKRPIESYLESPKRGRLCAVFLVNGQRQHAWDNAFIVHDLELKYLRNRMLIIVDVDGLKPHAVAKLMTGGRNQFYEGEVYDALRRRVIATLKGDPELQALEEEAESEVASLRAGDEVVKAALDQLIESHHDAAGHRAHGHLQPGQASRDDGVGGQLPQTIKLVVEGGVTVLFVQKMRFRDHRGLGTAESLRNYQLRAASCRPRPHASLRLAASYRPRAAP